MDRRQLTDALDEAPWLGPYVEDGDTDVETVRARYREGQRVAKRSIPPRTRLVRDGIRTTSYACVMNRYLVGRAVPYNTRTAVYEPEVGAYYETFQRGPLTADPDGTTIPLLLEHQGHEPVGRVRKTWETDDGLWAEAVLAGRVAELADLVDHDVVRGLSVGFIIDAHADRWTRTAQGVPHVTRQGARLKELSVTWRPTYQDATIANVNEHSTDWAEDRALVTTLRVWREADRRKQARLHAVS